MLDGSYDVSDDEWNDSVNFTCSMASQCNISPTETKVGFSVYAEENEIGFGFENTTNFEDFQTAANAVEKPERKSKSIDFYI